jgi:hypothetical protein
MRKKIQRAAEEAQSLVAAARQGELTRVSNLTYTIRDTLQDLWLLRADREEDWGDILNTLQIALEREDSGNFTVSECLAIQEVIGEHLALHEVDGENLEECVISLVKSGLSPWSGAAKEDQRDGTLPSGN